MTRIWTRIPTSQKLQNYRFYIYKIKDWSNVDILNQRYTSKSLMQHSQTSWAFSLTSHSSVFFLKALQEIFMCILKNLWWQFLKVLSRAKKIHLCNLTTQLRCTNHYHPHCHPEKYILEMINLKIFLPCSAAHRLLLEFFHDHCYLPQK